MSDGSEYGAVDLDDDDDEEDDMAQSALDHWLAEPSDLGRYEALVTDMASRPTCAPSSLLPRPPNPPMGGYVA